MQEWDDLGGVDADDGLDMDDVSLCRHSDKTNQKVC